MQLIRSAIDKPAASDALPPCCYTEDAIDGSRLFRYASPPMVGMKCSRRRLSTFVETAAEIGDKTQGSAGRLTPTTHHKKHQIDASAYGE